MANIRTEHKGNGKVIAENLNNRASVAIKELEGERVRKGRKPLSDEDKTPSARFHRVAGIRTRKIILHLRNLKACANMDVYFYSQDQVEYMFRMIRKQVESCEKAFANPERKEYASAKLTSIFDDMK